MKAKLTAIAFGALLAAAPVASHAQRIVEGPLVAGFGFAPCSYVVQMRHDGNMRTQLGQWALGYYSGLLALDVEGAAPAWNGLGVWLTRWGSDGRDLVAPVADRIVAQCEADPSLKVEVAAQNVAVAAAAEARR